MAATVSLTLKIDPALKETIKALAQENQTTISQEVTRRLLITMQSLPEPEVDNLDTEEEVAEPLTAAELKQLRALLKKGKKKK